MYRNIKPGWQKELAERAILKIDTLEEFEETSEVVDYYDYIHFMDDCQTVWAVPEMYRRYFPSNAPRYFAFAGEAESFINKVLRKNEINPDTVPLIPVMEYKLVPTGYVSYYDASLTPETRKMRRFYEKRDFENNLKRFRKEYQEKRAKLNEQGEGADNNNEQGED